MKSIGREAAIALAESKWWVGKPARDAALFALQTRELCLPMNDFYGLLHEALDRPVYTHELALNSEGIRQELLGERDAPSFDDILNLIPHDKRVVVQS
jgi:hypothetical protein